MNKDYLGQDFFLVSQFSLSPRQIATGILESSPDIVGFSVITVFYPEVSSIIRCLKEMKPELMIICGGPHCTLAPEHILQNTDVDFIFRGDADFSLPLFLDTLKTNTPDEIRRLPAESIPGISNTLEGKIIDRGLGQVLEEMDDAPFPYKEPYYKKNPSLKILYMTICSRGCIFKCTYCNSNNLRRMYKDMGKRYFRARSVENVMGELIIARDKYKPKYMMFIDNLFAPQEKWLQQFSEIYSREIGLPFFCETNPNVHDHGTIDLLADAGCKIVQFGFQSTVEGVRKDILHRRESNERIKDLVTYSRKRGMFVCVDHIANLPGEEKKHLTHAIEFYSEIRPNWINLGFIQYYPGADILQIALDRKVITQDEMDVIQKGEHQTSFRLLSKSQLTNFYRTLAIRLFCAIKLPKSFNKFMQKQIDRPLFESLFSKLGSMFIYGSRIVFAYTNKNDFLVRHHIIRNLYVMKIVFKEKYFKYGRHS